MCGYNMKYGVSKLSLLTSKMEISRYTHRRRARGKGFTGRRIGANGSKIWFFNIRV